MKILLVHCRYRTPGGEDEVVRQEARLLRDAGHEVEVVENRNEDLASMRGLKAFRVSIWNSGIRQTLRLRAKAFQPDLAHFHNIFHGISPGAYSVFRDLGIPVVQTLHNYRIRCMKGVCYRRGAICELCLHKTIPYPGVLHGCYQDSRVKSCAAGTSLMAHWIRGTWQKDVDLFTCHTEFSRSLFCSMGLPPEKLHIKPNVLVDDPGVGAGDGGFALFVGRLVEEKGVRVLIDAWRELPHIPLVIAGDGPLRSELERQARGLQHICFIGWQDRENLLKLLKSARALAYPSLWFESFPMALVESLACGTPVICSRLGSLPHIIRDGVHGVLIPPGDSVSLRDAAQRISASDTLVRLREACRAAYLVDYGCEAGLRYLLAAYKRVLGGPAGAAA